MDTFILYGSFILKEDVMLKVVELFDSREHLNLGITVIMGHNVGDYCIRINDDNNGGKTLYARVEMEDLIRALFETAEEDEDLSEIIETVRKALKTAKDKKRRINFTTKGKVLSAFCCFYMYYS